MRGRKRMKQEEENEEEEVEVKTSFERGCLVAKRSDAFFNWLVFRR